MGTIIYILLALLLLGIMVTVHELGHFCAARACGIAVRAFGVGFGPKLLSWTGKKSGTEYSLRLIPCGAFALFMERMTRRARIKKTRARCCCSLPGNG